MRRQHWRSRWPGAASAALPPERDLASGRQTVADYLLAIYGRCGSCAAVGRSIFRHDHFALFESRDAVRGITRLSRVSLDTQAF
jgi:hypothetical protein